MISGIEIAATMGATAPAGSSRTTSEPERDGGSFRGRLNERTRPAASDTAPPAESTARDKATAEPKETREPAKGPSPASAPDKAEGVKPADDAADSAPGGDIPLEPVQAADGSAAVPLVPPAVPIEIQVIDQVAAATGETGPAAGPTPLLESVQRGGKEWAAANQANNPVETGPPQPPASFLAQLPSAELAAETAPLPGTESAVVSTSLVPSATGTTPAAQTPPKSDVATKTTGEGEEATDSGKSLAAVQSQTGTAAGLSALLEANQAVVLPSASNSGETLTLPGVTTSDSDAIAAGSRQVLEGLEQLTSLKSGAQSSPETASGSTGHAAFAETLGAELATPARGGVEAGASNSAARVTGGTASAEAPVWQQLTPACTTSLRTGQQVRLQLNPPQLGHVAVDVAQHAQGIAVRVETESASTRQLLNQHLPQLRESLAQQGLTVDRLEVVVNPQLSSGQGDSRTLSQYQQQQGQEQERGAPLPHSGVAAGPAKAARSTAAPPGRPVTRMIELDIKV